MSRARGALVVSLHDVCARTHDACQTILACLAAAGVRRTSLLVIPADGGAELDAETATWLRALAGDGHEIVQHGYYHRRGADEPALRGWAATLDALLARGAGEFVALDEAEAARRLAAGRERLAAHGLAAEGFVAPAWLYSPGAAAAVRAAGFRYLTTHLRLRDLARGADHWSFGISNRPGPAAGDRLGRLVNRTLVTAHAPAPLVRLAIHPADLDFGRPFDHTLRLLDGLLAAGREPLTYLEWLERRP